MSKKTKEYIKSSIITFLTTFFMVIIAQWESLDMASFTNGAGLGILFAAARAGVKALIELFLKNFANPFE